MPNPYYRETFTAADGVQAKASALDAQFMAIEYAFDLLAGSLAGTLGLGGMRLTELKDTPSSYAGQGLRSLRVNVGENALEFFNEGQLVIKVVPGATYSFIASDAGALLLFTSGSPVVATIDAGVFDQGDVILVQQKGAGRVTFAAGAGVTINSSDALLATRTQHAQVGIVHLGSEEFTLLGERNAPTLGFASLVGGNQFSGAQAVNIHDLVDGANIATNASLSNNFRVTLGGNRTLDNPTNMRDGAIYNWIIKQDGTGGRTLAYGSKFKFSGGGSVSAAPSAVDMIVGLYDANADIIYCVLTKGFS